VVVDLDEDEVLTEDELVETEVDDIDELELLIDVDDMDDELDEDDDDELLELEVVATAV
jgi:hypothetical protein